MRRRLSQTLWRQPRIKGRRRDRTSTATETRLTAWLEREADRNCCSVSLVLASCVSFASGIPLDYSAPLRKR